jgi:ribosomal protein S18 acetylase RimI-like enzyme
VLDLSKSVALRTVVSEDKPFLLKVYAGTRADELAAVPWDQEQKRSFVKMQFDLQQRGYGDQFPAADHSIIILDGAAIGRIMVDRTSEDEIRGVDIALLPEYRKCGVGTYLIKELLSEAKIAGIPFRIEVEKFNQAAIRLYERLGFVRTGESFTHVAMEWAASPE